MSLNPRFLCELVGEADKMERSDINNILYAPRPHILPHMWGNIKTVNIPINQHIIELYFGYAPPPHFFSDIDIG
jgi:hypothetical protein